MKHSLADQSTLAGHAGVEASSHGIIGSNGAHYAYSVQVAEGSRWTKSICENIQPSQLHLHYSKLSD
ncbi:hypothetical protein RRG08_044082 [Elysia crispata]|uniref:Uncharacterized protein n=1 Tax=Elysia crispata TaxID=231223 RepID=A0AAE1AXU1_9GAST|nr:hypothetical protein RRG08_044082 [Elysia crispata]